ncbi:MAG: ArsR family transcriptional regulator [Acidobacteriota bacterium]
MTSAITNILKETRCEILGCLKSRGRLSVDQIAASIGISKVCVRRHLALLSRDGLVGYQIQKPARGRPGHLYHLTDKAAILFPTAYSNFALELLKQVRNLFGPSAVSKILTNQADETIRTIKPKIEGLGFDEKVRRLFSIVNERGYDVTIRKLKDGSYLIKQRNCPTPQIAASHQQICEEELRVYRELLGVELIRECRIVAGAQSCDYRIFPPGTKTLSIVKMEKNK